MHERKNGGRGGQGLALVTAALQKGSSKAQAAAAAICLNITLHARLEGVSLPLAAALLPSVQVPSPRFLPLLVKGFEGVPRYAWGYV